MTGDWRKAGFSQTLDAEKQRAWIAVTFGKP